LGLYSSLIVSAFAMLTLMRLDSRALPRWLSKADHFFGNLSYPIYLCHWGVGIVMIGLFHGKSRADVSVFLIGFPIVNLVAYAIYTYVERPLQSWKLRSPIKTTPESGLGGRHSIRWRASTHSPFV
jgi:peptidoglycan/LPS O-acetylase OafA/YrhL